MTRDANANTEAATCGKRDKDDVLILVRAKGVTTSRDKFVELLEGKAANMPRFDTDQSDESLSNDTSDALEIGEMIGGEREFVLLHLAAGIGRVFEVYANIVIDAI